MNSTAVSARPNLMTRLVASTPLLALIALVCWAFASPIGSSPDDDFHLSSIWCGLGERPGTCESIAGNIRDAKVPKSVVDANQCYAGKPDQSAGCQAAIEGVKRLVATDRVNSYGLYPPVYYAFMSLFVGPNTIVSALVMRIVNCVLFIGLTSTLYFLLPHRRRDTLLYVSAIGLVPLGFFLLASNNPSAWAIISGGTLWLALVGYFETAGRRRLGLAVLAAIAVIMGAGARADSALYCVFAVGLSVLLTARNGRAFWLKAIFPVVLLVASVAFYFSASQSGVASSGFNGPAVTNKLTLAWQNFIELPSLWAGSFGTWPLGWLDTTMPAIVWVFALASFSAVLFTGLSAVNTRKIFALAGLGLLLFVIPFWLLLRSNLGVGEAVQPRYLLPMILMFAGVALFQLNQRGFSVSRFQSVLIAVALSAVNSMALHVNIQRYTTGLDVSGFNLNHSVQWWWSGFIPPMVLWVIGTLAFTAAAVFALWQASGISARRSRSVVVRSVTPSGAISDGTVG